MRTYTIDTATGETTQTSMSPAIAAATDDAYFLDPAAPGSRPLPDHALRALADLVEIWARKMFPDRFPPRPEQPGPAAGGDD